MIKVLTGVLRPTSGTISLQGKNLVMNSHSDAIAHGIDAVYQTLALADHLTPAANMFLGSELTRKFCGIEILDNKRMRSEAEKTLKERLGVTLRSMDVTTDSLSGGQRQAIAIARAVYHSDLKVLVMDEPTAALGPRETARTLKLIEAVRDQGLGVIVISHSLDDVFAVSDRIQIMRRGKRAGLVKTSESDITSVLGIMVGAAPEQVT